MGCAAGGRNRGIAADARPQRRLLGLGAVAWIVLCGSALAGEPEPGTDKIAEPSTERRRRDDDSQRAAAIRRAREEIRKNPSQKKFILFRYDLREQDLR